MKNIRKAILLTIAAALIMALALCVFVACNGNNKQDKDDLEPADPMIELDSSEIESYLAWMLEESEYGDARVRWSTFSQQMIEDRNLVYFANGSVPESRLAYNPIGEIYIRSERSDVFEPTHDIHAYFFASKKDAEGYASTLGYEQEAVVRQDRVYLTDSAEVQYLENAVFTKKLSSSAMNQTLAKEILKNVQKTVDNFYSITAEIYVGGQDNIRCSLDYETQNNSARYSERIYPYVPQSGISESEIRDALREMYGEGSSVKFNEQGGYMKLSLVSQDSFEMEGGLLFDQATTSKSKSFTVPEYVNGRQVTKFLIGEGFCAFRGITSITVEHGIDVTIRDNNYLETLTLPADVGEVKLSNLPKLTRIRYGGTVAEWKARFSQSAVYEWGNYYQYKNGEVRLAHNDIAVRASDGNVSYEQTPKDKVTITYSLGEYTGGSAPSSQTVDRGTPITLPSAPSWPGHTFTGWRPAGSSATLGANATYIANQSVTFTAQWTTNGSENPPTPSVSATQEFFDELWTRSASIGNSGEIGEGENFYVHTNFEIGLGLMLDLDNPQPSDLLTHFGVELEAVIDRESKNSEGSAIKARLYAGTNNILTVYFFMNDNKNLYIDFDGQQIKINAQLLKSGYTDQYYNDELGSMLNGLLNGDAKQYLDSIMKDMGDDWTLNTLITNIFAINGIDLEELMGQSLIQSLAKAFGVNVDDVFTADGFDLYAFLTAPKMSTFFDATKDDNKYHLASTDSLRSLLGALAGLNIILDIDFEAEGKDGFKDGVTFTIGLPDIKSKATIDDRQRNVYPYLTVAIKDLVFAPAAGKTIALNKYNYTNNVAFAYIDTLEFDGIRFNGTTLPDPTGSGIDVEAGELGDFEIGVMGQLDLANSVANETKAMAYISYCGKNIITASFANGALGIKIDRTVKVAGIPVIDTVVKYTGPALYEMMREQFPEGFDGGLLSEFENAFFADSTHTVIKDTFKGVVIDGIDAYDLLVNIIIGTIQDLTTPSQGTAQAAAEMRAFDVGLLSELSSVITPLFAGLFDGKIQLGTTNGLQFVCDMVNTLYGLPIMNGRTEVEPAWTMSNVIKNEIAPMFEDIAPCLDELLDETYFELMTEDQVKSLLGLGRDEDPTPGQIWAATIMSAFNAELSLDFTRGIDFAVKVGFGDVSIGFSYQIGIITEAEFNARFVDVASEYETQYWDRTGWFYISA